MGRQANPKGLDLGLASDCPGRAFPAAAAAPSLAAGRRTAGDGSVLNVVMPPEKALPL